MDRIDKVLIIIALFIMFSFAYVGIEVSAADISSFSVISQILKCNVRVNEANTVFVNSSYNENTSGWGTVRFNDIHKALAEVPDGGTINIECSPYVIMRSEAGTPLTVNKDVSIKGTNESGTTIQIGEHFYGSSPIIVNSSGKLGLSDLIIDGSGRYTSFAVFCIGGEVRMNNVKIRNININKGGYGIKVKDSSDEPGWLYINNCSFSDIAGCAIYVYRSNARIGVDLENIFTGGGSRAFSDDQCAICIEDGVDVKVHQNKIAGYKAESAKGIFLLSGKAEILGNKVSDSGLYRGIYINTGTVVGEDEATTETAAAIGGILTVSNSASVGVYDSGEMVYPAE